MQNSESVKIEATTTMTAAATPIQGTEGSHGDGEKGIACSSQTMELKGGADDVTEADSLDPKPLAVVGHKRKASSEIDPHCVNSPDSVSSPTVEQHAEMVLQGGDNEKVEGDNNMPQKGILLDLNQGPEEMDAYLYDDVFKEKVETVAKDNIEVKPEGKKDMLHRGLSDFDLNQEGVVDSNSDREKEKVETGDVENPDVKPEEDKGIPHGGLSKMDTNQGEGTVNSITDVEKETQVETDSVENKEVVPYVAENVEVGPCAIEKIEGEPSAVVENTEGALPASENKQVEHASSVDEIEMELNCELNKESDPFSDNEVESKTSAVPAETHAADENEVELEADAADKMEVEPYDVAPEKKNEEVEADAAEKVEVVAHAVDPEKKKNKEVELDAVEKVGAQPSTEKHEAGPSTTGENEVETSPVKVHGLLRGPLDFDLDLNELPSMEED